MKSIRIPLLCTLFVATSALANQKKEIAITFDDAPVEGSLHFTSRARTKAVIGKLKKLQVEQVMVFATPCRPDPETSLSRLKPWAEAGHYLANHSCTHPDFEKTPVSDYLQNLNRADKLLSDLFPKGKKFFRFPYLREGNTVEARDAAREWLKSRSYRTGHVSIDNDEWLFHSKLNVAKKEGKPIDYSKVSDLYVEHLLGAVEFYDKLAVEVLGRRPKHVLLLHEIDSSVLFIEALVNALRKNGWAIIDPLIAYEDPLYQALPKNLYSNNGLIAQLAEERGHGRRRYSDSLREKLDKILN